jgi:hypothetical protein
MFDWWPRAADAPRGVAPALSLVLVTIRRSCCHRDRDVDNLD